MDGLIGIAPTRITLYGDSTTVYANKIRVQLGNLSTNTVTITFKITLMKLPELNYVLGDVNGDGIIDENDLQLISEYSVGNTSFNWQQFKAADINKDGKVDTIDASRLNKYINKGEPLE